MFKKLKCKLQTGTFHCSFLSKTVKKESMSAEMQVTENIFRTGKSSITGNI